MIRVVALAFALVFVAGCSASPAPDAAVAPFYEPYVIGPEIRADVEAALDAMAESGHRMAWVKGRVTDGATRISGQRFFWYFSFVTDQSEAVEDALEDAGLLCHTDLNAYYREASDRRREEPVAADVQ